MCDCLQVEETQVEKEVIDIELTKTSGDENEVETADVYETECSDNNSDYKVWCDLVRETCATFIKGSNVFGIDTRLRGQCLVNGKYVLTNGPLLIITERRISGIEECDADVEYYTKLLATLEGLNYRAISTKETRGIKDKFNAARKQYMEMYNIKRLSMDTGSKIEMQKTGLFDFKFLQMQTGYSFSIFYLQDLLRLVGYRSARLFLSTLHGVDDSEVPVIRVRGEYCTVWLLARKSS